MKKLAQTAEERRQQLFTLGFTLAKQDILGILNQVFFICEAWLSKINDPSVVMPPSQDSKRVEILLISQIDTRQHSTQVAIFEMRRDLDDRLIDLHLFEGQPSSAGINVKSPLLLAFVHVYALGLLGGLSR